MADDDTSVTFTFDGTQVRAVPGQTLAAALMSAGVRTWSVTRRQGTSRGVYCGMGVCFSCLIVLNGRPNTRACLVRVEDGDVVSTQKGTGHGELA
jgi:predicted molibdopterin-dependent oxidoreductase YjgC